MRTIAEIYTAAKNVSPGDPVVITTEEARSMVKEVIAARTSPGHQAPSPIHLMDRCRSGRARIHGRAIEVKD